MEKTKRQREFLALAKLCLAGRAGRALDGMVFKALYPTRKWELMGGVWHAEDPEDAVAYDPPPHYSTSIDAARKAMTREPDAAELFWPKFEEGNDCFTVHLHYGGFFGVAPTLELAWLAAVLNEHAYLSGPKCPGCNEAPAANRQKTRPDLCAWCGYNHATGEQARLVPASTDWEFPKQ